MSAPKLTIKLRLSADSVPSPTTNQSGKTATPSRPTSAPPSTTTTTTGKQRKASGTSTPRAPPPSSSSAVKKPPPSGDKQPVKPVARWRWTWATLPTPLNGRLPGQVRVWAREGGLIESTSAETKTSNKKAEASKAKLETKTTTPTTFVCPHTDCHKIFNGRDQWRRHVNQHKRKALLPLRLTLNTSDRVGEDQSLGDEVVSNDNAVGDANVDLEADLPVIEEEEEIESV